MMRDVFVLLVGNYLGLLRVIRKKVLRDIECLGRPPITLLVEMKEKFLPPYYRRPKLDSMLHFRQTTSHIHLGEYYLHHVSQPSVSHVTKTTYYCGQPTYDSEVVI